MEPVSKPNLNRLFIGCFEKTRLFYGKKYTSKEKKSTKFIFNQILNTVNSLYSGHCRDLKLVSSLARVRNSGSLFQSNVCNLFFPGI